jgi:hypothetical protein
VADSDVAAVVAWWAGPGLEEHVELVLTGSDVALERVREAAARADAAVLARHDGEAELATGGDVQGVGADGPVVRVESFDESPLRTWLAAFSHELADVPGRLVVHELPERPAPEPTSAEPVTVTAVLAVSGWRYVNMVGRERARGVWRNDPTQIEPLADLAMAWLEDGDGPYELQMGPSSEPRPDQVRELMTTAMADDAMNGGLGLAGGHVARRATDSVRRVQLGRIGHVLLSSHDVTPVSDRVDRLTELSLPWAARSDWISIWEFAGYELDDSYRNSHRGGRLPRYYGNHRDKDQELVPDACAWQVVTGRHLGRMHDLGDWIVETVAPDRHLVRTRDLGPWFGYRDRSDRPTKLFSTYVDDAVLARARADFGSAIMPAEQPPAG